jgi:hypothetical protein
MSEPFYDARVGLRFAGMSGQRPEKIRWYVNPLFEPEEGDNMCTVEHTLLPLKKATESLDVTTQTHDVATKLPDDTTQTHDVATKLPNDTTQTHDVATKLPNDMIQTHDVATKLPDDTIQTHDVATKLPSRALTRHFNTLKCVECGATFKNKYAKHNHFRRGRCLKKTDVTNN